MDMDKVGKIAAHRIRLTLLALPMLVAMGGCRICADCEGESYPAYGGAWQRTLRDSGRVGSVFDPAGAKVSELAERDTPQRPDEIQRQQHGDVSDALDGPDASGDTPEMNPDAIDPDAEKLDNRSEQLRDLKLDDIESSREQELRNRRLEDLNIRIIPGAPAPPSLQ